MVAREQHVGHRHPAKHRGPRVVRKVEQPAAERIVRNRLLVAHHARHHPARTDELDVRKAAKTLLDLYTHLQSVQKREEELETRVRVRVTEQ